MLLRKELYMNNNMIDEIKEVILSSRKEIAYEVNRTMLIAYWNVGRIIVENEQKGNVKAEYGKQIIKELSKKGTAILIVTHDIKFANDISDKIIKIKRAN